jgi:hypothetical protein
MEEADDAGNAIPDTETYAASETRSPTKERPSSSRAIRRTESIGLAGPSHADSDSTTASNHKSKSRSKDKDRDKGREKNKEKSAKRVSIDVPRVERAQRPSMGQHSATTPAVTTRRRQPEDPQYYGASAALPIATPAVSRPRAQSTAPRPASFYGTRPPSTSARWQTLYQDVQPAAPPAYGPVSYPSAANLTPTYSSPYASSGYAYPGATDYFTPQQPLIDRFTRPTRPASAMGYHSSSSYSQSGSGDAPSLPRRPSIRQRDELSRLREEEARRQMPPPAVPVARRPSRASSRPPSTSRRGFSDDAFYGGDTYYAEVPSARRYSGQYGLQYDAPAYRTDVAVSGGSRRNSYIGSSDEDKMGATMRQASSYQDDVGATAPLTTDALRKVRRSGELGSRSTTRSSISKDDSDYKRSATTRTSTNDEEYTLRIRGTTTVRVGGAEVECPDGAEIDVIKRTNSNASRAGGSQTSSFIDPKEQRPDRRERASNRIRAPSQSGSWSRSTPASRPDDYAFHHRGYDATQQASYSTHVNGWI